MPQTIYYENDFLISSCSECSGDLYLDEFRGELICRQCGLVSSTRIIDFVHFERKMFDMEDMKEKHHHGEFQTLLNPHVSFSTVMKGNKINNSDFFRISKLDSRLKIEDKSLLHFIRETKRLCYNLSLPRFILESTILNFRKFYHKKGLNLKGFGVETMACCFLYYICREFQLPITIQDILNESNTDFNRFKRCYRKLLTKFNLRVLPLHPTRLIGRYINEFGLKNGSEKKAISILSKLPKSFYNAKNPKCVCGAIIYLICNTLNRKTTQKEIANRMGISVLSIRHIYQEIKKYIKS
ncbi:MAG: hypothetical protein ACTSRH_04430 [Promethearchaeota archaeon]